MQVSIDLQAQVSVAKAWLVSLILFVFHQCKLGLCFSKRKQIPKLNEEILGNWLELCCCCCLEHGLILKLTPKENSIFRKNSCCWVPYAWHMSGLLSAIQMNLYGVTNFIIIMNVPEVRCSCQSGGLSVMVMLHLYNDACRCQGKIYILPSRPALGEPLGLAGEC